jgi:hypothetical protein
MTAKKIADMAEAMEKLGYEIVGIEDIKGILAFSHKFSKIIKIKLGFVDPNSKAKAD